MPYTKAPRPIRPLLTPCEGMPQNTLYMANAYTAEATLHVVYAVQGICHQVTLVLGSQVGAEQLQSHLAHLLGWEVLSMQCADSQVELLARPADSLEEQPLPAPGVRLAPSLANTACGMWLGWTLGDPADTWPDCLACVYG